MWDVDPPFDNLPEQPPHPNFGIVSILSQRTFTFKEFIRQDNIWKRENTFGKIKFVFSLILCGIAPIIGGVYLLLKNMNSEEFSDDILGVGTIILVFGVFMTLVISASLTHGDKV